MNGLPTAVVTIDEYWLNFAVSTLLPVIVAVVTKRFADSATRVLLLAFLAIVNGWLQSLFVTGGTFELSAAVTSIFISFLTAVVTHVGALNGLVTGDNGPILKAIPGGLGKVDEAKRREVLNKAA